jgi:hypothetical protein
VASSPQQDKGLALEEQSSNLGIIFQQPPLALLSWAWMLQARTVDQTQGPQAR